MKPSLQTSAFAAAFVLLIAAAPQPPDLASSGGDLSVAAVPAGRLADPGHPGGSVNVAFVPSPVVSNGGVLPTSGGAFTNFTFSNLPVASVSLANLAPYDTVVLNVASSGMACNTANLTASQKADLNAFVFNGGKLIIYDSECTFGGSVDYSWLTYPFATVNPGATGAFGGVLTIAEENALAKSAPGDPHYIDTNAIVNQTDAVGDMNVVNLTTVDPHWCLAMTGTNIVNFSGAVHMYARSGQGLYIYNGLDVDYISSAVGPSGAGQLAKLWLQELETGKGAADLPCGIAVVGIALSPPSATGSVGTSHTVTALLTNLQGVPQPGIPVTFTVSSGPNVGAVGTCAPNANCATDATGQASFTYLGTGGIGMDTIQACFTNTLGALVCSAPVTCDWIVTGCVPTAVTNIGGGCGNPGMQLGMTLPVFGRSLSLRVAAPASNAPLAVVVQTAPFGQSIPLAPPCMIQVDPLNASTIIQSVTDSSGEWRSSFQIAAVPELLALPFRVQAGVLSTAGPVPEIILSDALQGLVGTCPPCTASRERWVDLGDPVGQLFQAHWGQTFPNNMDVWVHDPSGGSLPANGYRFMSGTGRDALYSFLANLPPILPAPVPFTPIPQDMTNPTMSAQGCSGSMARYAAVLQLNIVFNASGDLGSLPSIPTFGNMVYVKPGDSLSGLNVFQILERAQLVLAGVLPVPAGHTCESFTELLEMLSLSFNDCTPSAWAQINLFAI